MAFCTKCGTQLTEGFVFCGSCGAPVGAAASPGPAIAPNAGMASNVAGMLAYFPFVGWIIAIVFLFVEPLKTDKFVRFHALQSIFLNVALMAFWIVYRILSRILGAITLGVLGVVMGLLGLLVFLAILVYCVFLMYKAYNNEKYMIPYIGPLAAKQAGV